MSGETIKNKAEELKGAAKEKFGDATNNEELQAEGSWEKNSAQAKQAVHETKEHIKDAAEDVKDTFGR